MITKHSIGTSKPESDLVVSHVSVESVYDDAPQVVVQFSVYTDQELTYEGIEEIADQIQLNGASKAFWVCRFCNNTNVNEKGFRVDRLQCYFCSAGF